MNHQLLIESYSFGTTLSNQEIELLTLELETQIMNMNISTDFACFKSAPTHICKGLNLRKGTSWIICLSEVLDIHKPPKICLLYTSPSPRDRTRSRMPSSA